MPTASFDQVLSGKRATRRLGNARLRYDGQLLIVKTVPALDARSLGPDAILLVATVCGALSLTALVLPELFGGVAWAFGFAALAATAAWAGSRAALRRRGLSFIVNFDQHVVRVDRPAATAGARSVHLPFAEASVEVVAGPVSLGLDLCSGKLRERVIDRVPEGDRVALEGIARLLADAFAATPAPPA